MDLQITYLALAHLGNILLHRFVKHTQLLHNLHLHLGLELIHVGIHARKQLALQFHVENVANNVRKVVHDILI